MHCPLALLYTVLLVNVFIPCLHLCSQISMSDALAIYYIPTMIFHVFLTLPKMRCDVFSRAPMEYPQENETVTRLQYVVHWESNECKHTCKSLLMYKLHDITRYSIHLCHYTVDRCTIDLRSDNSVNKKN